MIESSTIPAHRRNWYNHVRAIWRKQLQPLWHAVRWPILGILWLSALALGYVGFATYFTARGQPYTPLDLIYLSAQLFPLQSGAVPGPLPWQLDLARFLAPGIAGFTVLRALAAIFADQLQAVRVRTLRNHVVVCGLGRTGARLAKAFQDRGNQVVGIDLDAENDLLQPCRDYGVRVLIGDATDPDVLRRAGVHKARHLFAVCGDDGPNVEIAMHARALNHGRQSGVLTAIVQIIDPHLYHLLKHQEFEVENAAAFRLEFFNIFDRGAQVLLSEYRPFDRADQDGDAPPHLLVVGLGRMGERLVAHAARNWRSRYTTTGERLHITLVDKEAERKKELLCLRYPQLEKLCELVTIQINIHSLEFQRGTFLLDRQGRHDVTAVYVCLDNDQLGLSVALTLLQRLGDRQVPIVVRMAQDAGLATLLRTGEGNGRFTNLHAFALLDRTCQPDLLLGGTHEILARAVHEEYLWSQLMLGETPTTNSSMALWEELPESLQESNRRQADHIGVKLKAIGCDIVPLTDWEAESFQFTKEEVESIARLEHARFVDERLRAGWSPGPKASKRKTSPYLVHWEQLPEEMKESNRNTVRALPGFLARAGFQIERLRHGEALKQ